MAGKMPSFRKHLSKPGLLKEVRTSNRDARRAASSYRSMGTFAWRSSRTGNHRSWRNSRKIGYCV